LSAYLSVDYGIFLSDCECHIISREDQSYIGSLETDVVTKRQQCGRDASFI